MAQLLIFLCASVGTRAVEPEPGAGAQEILDAWNQKSQKNSDGGAGIRA